jgi:carboxyl-terminal processing protease
VAAAVGAALLSAWPAAGQDGTDYRALFEQVWKTVDENFYEPTFRGHDWRAIGGRYRAKVSTVRNDTEFERLVEAMLGELETSHLNLNPPRTSSASGVGIGASLRPLDGAPTVIEVAPLSDAQRKGLKPGDQIVGGREQLSGPVGSEASLSVRGCDGRVRALKVRREGAFWPPPQPAIGWRTLRTGPGRTLGYLRVDRFDDGQAEMADRAMADLKDTDGLVIDVRQNSGGNTSALRLGSYLTEGGERPVVALFARPWLEKLGRRVTAADVAAAPKTVGAYTTAAVFKAVEAGGGAAAFWAEDLGERRYRKPVVVLIGEDTGSAAEGFAWMVKLHTRARLVGRPTPGVLLSGETFDLPGGWKLTVPVSGIWGPRGEDFGDRGVTPAETVAFTRADLCAGRDPDLYRAMDILGR